MTPQRSAVILPWLLLAVAALILVLTPELGAPGFFALVLVGAVVAAIQSLTTSARLPRL